MKKILLFTGLVFSLCTSFNAQAQVNVSVQFGRPVAQERWYANDNDYYYLPEQGVYYNVQRRVYVFPEGGNWYTANRLPSRYGNYTYRSSNYVRVHDRSPFNRHSQYRQRYGNNPKANGRHDNRNHNGNYSNGNSGRVNHERIDNRSRDNRGREGHGNKGGDNGRGNGGRGNGHR